MGKNSKIAVILLEYYENTKPLLVSTAGLVTTA